MSQTTLAASSAANNYTLRNNEDGSFDILRGTTVVQSISATGVISGNGSGLTGINSTPAGTIIDFGGSSAPSGYLACNGAAVSRTTYADLFAAIGVLWGVGDNSTTFNLPNFAVGDAAVQGGTVGAATNGVIISHTHAVNIPEWSANTGGGVSQAYAVAGAGAFTQSVTSVSAGTGTKNLAAGKNVLKCIKI
jgi:microcystin-dependent protein